MTKDNSTFVADPSLLKELAPRSRAIELSADRILFHQGDQPAGVYILHEGSVSLSMNSGEEVTLRTVAGAGSLLGLPAVIGDKPYSLTAKAQLNARISFVRSDDFLAIMQGQPMIMFRVLQVLAQEIRAAREAFSDFVDASGVIS